jgi:hypothetical protein
VWAGAFPNATPTGYQEVQLQRPFVYSSAPNLHLSVLVVRRSGNVQSAAGTRARYLYGVTMNPVRIACRRNTTSGVVGSILTATNVLPNMRLTFGMGASARTVTLGATARLFPVPATETVTLDAPTWTAPLTYTIADALGRTVRPATAMPASPTGQHRLDVSGLGSGSYHVHLRSGSRSEVVPLVRE